MAPPPFCIEPPQNGPCVLAPGDGFSFRLKLFSYAVDYLPYFIHAFKIAGERGLGSDIRSGHGRLSLVDVRQQNISIYDGTNQRLLQWHPEELAMPRLRATHAHSSLRLCLLSPLRFKQANHLASILDFGQLTRLILRRMASLLALENKTFPLPQQEFDMLWESAADVRVVANNLRWQDWRRYSGRQNTAMQLGGLVGDISYSGPVGVFGEYLDFAVKAHIGKQTSFGLGRLAADWQSWQA